jgi:ribonuclease HI
MAALWAMAVPELSLEWGFISVPETRGILADEIIPNVDRRLTCFIRNVSEALPGARQTNQRAELTAIIRALDVVPRNRDVTIVTDSRYAIDCVTSWCITWRKNGWKNAAGKAVENKDLIENILHKVEDRQGFKVQTKFEWIKGHANHAGNVEADKLAVDGARKAGYM